MAVDLGKQMGPLPMGAWVAAIGGGLAIAYYARNRNASANTNAVALTDPTGANPNVGVGGLAAVGATGDTTAQVTGAAISSNAQWGQQAFTFLVATGADGALADKAVRDYLSGIPLSLSENAMISLALTKLGQPPEALPDAPDLPQAPVPVATPAPVTVPAPAPPISPPVAPPAPRPPAARTYTVVRGDSLWKIANKMYGNPMKWTTIYNANRGVIGGNPSRIYAGQVYIIP